MASPIIIRINNLCRTYNRIDGRDIKRQELFQNLNLEVEEGEFVALVGASGCGKSTLLNMIGTLDSIGNRDRVKVPEQDGHRNAEFVYGVEGNGQVVIDGQDISQLSGDAKAEFINTKIGFIFQFHHLIPELTAWQNVALPMRIRGASAKAAHERAKELLHEMDLGEHLRKKPNILSGGEKQRVAIARALINSPKVLLADEPTGSLHPKFKAEIIQKFVKLKEEKKLTIVMVTHDQESLYDVEHRLHVSRIVQLERKGDVV